MSFDLTHCRVCKKEITNTLVLRQAKLRVEEPICSTECNRKEIIQRFGCCEKAELTPCVCMYSFDCPVHGKTHIGTHD